MLNSENFEMMDSMDNLTLTGCLGYSLCLAVCLHFKVACEGKEVAVSSNF